MSLNPSVGSDSICKMIIGVAAMELKRVKGIKCVMESIHPFRNSFFFFFTRHAVVYTVINFTSVTSAETMTKSAECLAAHICLFLTIS